MHTCSLIINYCEYICKWIKRFLRISNTGIPKLVYQYTNMQKKCMSMKEKDGEMNTHEDVTSLDVLYPGTAEDHSHVLVLHFS